MLLPSGTASRSAYALLSGDDETPGAVDLLGEASNAVDAAAQLDGELSTSAGQLLDLYYNAKDAAADLIGRLDAYETNDAELDEIEQRIDLIYKLKRKYGDTVEDIIAFGQKAREELELIQSSQERVEHLQAEQHRLYVLAREKAETLTQTRLKAFEELNKRISETLDFLNMPGVRMTLHHARGPLASHGQDSIEFYISTNPGEAPKPLAKIASGGELSRITLAIKNAMADKDAVPTVIYDEIDSGVSGKAASRIGEVLRQSAEGHQILCITHTAQIAALADCHLLIQKNIANERTYTEIHPLDEDGRVDALAHLISGDHVTELSRANAREMLEADPEWALTTRFSCDKLTLVKSDDGNKYPERVLPREAPVGARGVQNSRRNTSRSCRLNEFSSRLCRVRALQTQECPPSLRSALVRPFP